VQHLKQRAVARGRARKAHVVPPRIGMDEKAIAKGQTYLTLTCDLMRGTVEHLADGRTLESAASYFSTFNEAELSKIEAVAMDMCNRIFGLCRQPGPMPSARSSSTHFTSSRMRTKQSI
jgi:transposase